MFESNLQPCIAELLLLDDKNKERVPQIIARYCKITTPELPELSKIQLQQQDLNQDKYIPSTDGLLSLNSVYHKTWQGKSKPVENNKMKSLYGDHFFKNTVSFDNRYESQNGMIKPSLLVEERQETILRDLMEKKIQATIPQMESSLKMHELSSLHQKQIKIENFRQRKQEKDDNNTGKLVDWRKMREKLAKNLRSH